MKKLFKPFFNPYIGPILVISIILFYILFFILPKLSEENKKDEMVQRSIELIDNLKKIRSYYTSHVVNKIKNYEEIKINYDYEDKKDTIPLPATLLHDLSKLVAKKEMNIKLYSDYPFPNRKNRVLDKYEKESLAFLINNPIDIYKKTTIENNKKVFKIAVSDIFYEQSCVTCHNTRSDTPKDNWKLGDVRGVIQITMPFKNDFLLSSSQQIFIISLLVILILILGVHYTVISFIRQKEHNNTQRELEKKVEERTKSLESTVKLLNQYKKAVDFSAIVPKTDKYGFISYVNEEFIKISKYTQEELLGKKHNIIRHEDMPNEVFEDLWETILNKQIWKGQIKNKAKDGSSYYVLTTIVPILNMQDEIEEFLAIRLDVSNVVKSQIQAQRADEAKSIFLANMSHEIRTPLNAIIGFSELLSKNEELKKENKKQAQIIQTSANSLLSIINDILDISKIESGNFDITIEKTDLYFISEHVVELFSKKASEKEINLIFNLDKKIPLCVLTDGIRIRQVLSNLLSNAIKFTKEQGEISLNINLIEEKKDKCKIRFEVKDNGIGIAKEKLETIFKPFIQVDHKSNREYEGTGLGLSISSHIIQSLGSKIEVQSDINKGTSFSFLLSFDICSDKVNKIIPKEEKKSSYKGKVLVAEDNEANQELISYILDSMNIEYSIQENGLKALEEYKEDFYDVVLMDINMPVLDGIESFKKIREYEKKNLLKVTPVVALTANAVKGDKEKFLSLGMDAYLSKPINTNELKIIFDSFLIKNENIINE